MNIENELSEGLALVTAGHSYNDRLNAVGIDTIIDLIGAGFHLKALKDRKGDGILDLLNIPENRFNEWVSGQTIDSQMRYNSVVQSQSNRIQNDLLFHAMEVIDEYDKLMEELSREGSRGMTKVQHAKLKVLSLKQKAANDLLKTINVGKMVGHSADEIPRIPETAAKPSAEVSTTAKQNERLEKFKEG